MAELSVRREAILLFWMCGYRADTVGRMYGVTANCVNHHRRRALVELGARDLDHARQLRPDLQAQSEGMPSPDQFEAEQAMRRGRSRAPESR